MDFQRRLLEMDRRAWKGVWHRATLSRSRSAARCADRRQGICRPQPRDEDRTGGAGGEEAQPARRAKPPQPGETCKNREVVKGEDDLRSRGARERSIIVARPCTRPKSFEALRAPCKPIARALNFPAPEGCR